MRMCGCGGMYAVTCDVSVVPCDVSVMACGVVMMYVVKVPKQKAPVSYSGIQGLQKTATTYSPTVTQYHRRD